MKWWIVIVTIFIAVSCSNEIDRPDQPEGLIPRDTMVLVLHDLVVLESYAQMRYQLVNNYHKVMKASGRQCLQKYQVDPKRFENSYNYYASRQKELQSIYQEVMDTLTKEMNSLTISYGKTDDTIQVAPR